jgi:GrpB-like predicted nucleotidyltransferase (UPF0157 family)
MASAPLVITDYNPEWPRMYEKEKTLILQSIGHIIADIEHIGSTSVPGLGAKPIVDIMIGLHRLDDAAECIPRLEAIGHTYHPEFEDQVPERRFFRKGPDEARTHHIHMVERSSSFWADRIVFRDYMRTHEEDAMLYLLMKKELAVRFGSNRRGYSDAKASFVAAILTKVRVFSSIPTA